VSARIQAGQATRMPGATLFNFRSNRLRWTILALVSTMFFITFLDKAVISATAPLISREFQIDKVSMGVVFSAFVLASAIGQIPAGWDRAARSPAVFRSGRS
jgi:MFS family permease